MADSDKYEVLCKIGQGSFGIISKVKRKSDGLILCRKEISYLKMSQKEKEQLQAELSILKDLRHPNIVQYYEREHLKVTSDLHMYMEYCGNGDLGQVIKDYIKRGEQAPEAFVWTIFTQIVTALYRCHNGQDAPGVGDNWFGLKKRIAPPRSQKYCVIHRDLKPENVFLDSDNNVKLGDFGLSKIIRSHDFASTYVGTPYYMSPELAASERYTSASDIWSLGCIIHELCAQEVPFDARSHLELFQKIRLGRSRPIPPVYSHELQKVISSCLQVNPNSRPTAAQLLDLPIVCIVRKQQEAVLLNKDLEKKTRDVEAKTRQLHAEIDAKLRREWEVKARLEIDKQVAAAKAHLMTEFDAAVSAKADQLFQSKMRQIPHQETSSGRSSLSGQTAVDSASESGLAIPDLPSITQLVSADLGVNLERLSLGSDVAKEPRRRSVRTPFTRAQTTTGLPGLTTAIGSVVPSFDMPDCFSPMDIHMDSPSPATLGSLNLSPRRESAKSDNHGIISLRLQGNIFAAAKAIDPSKRWVPLSDSDISTVLDEEENDNVDNKEDQCAASLDDLRKESPSRPAQQAKRKINIHGTTPTKTRKPPPRPSITRERTAPVNIKRLTSTPSLFPPLPHPSSTATTTAVPAANPRPASATPVLAASPARKPLVASPARAKNGTTHSVSPALKAATFRSKKGMLEDGLSKPTITTIKTRGQITAVHGRTLVQLAQARAGGIDRTGMTGDSLAGALQSPSKEAPIWDPDVDEMPSPFLTRGRTTRSAWVR